jgi:acyl-CoA synthetase (AMP-forming)/AMP-acid ligase II/acyl carrier protein
MTGVATLVDLLRSRAESQPDQAAYIYLADGELAEQRLTYGELDQAAMRIAATLRRSRPAGERVLLLFPPGLAYIEAFFGCLYAGMVGVCAYPPPITRGLRLLPRLRAIVSDSQARVALTTGATLASAQAFLQGAAEWKDLLWLRTDRGEGASKGEAWVAPGTTADSLAFLMYTSGSTGSPKGVMVRHGNAMHNLAAFPGFRKRPLTASVSWLPLFHDLGLVFGVLQPLYQGAPAILMPPEAFVRRPVRWLQAISRYRASATFGPNFAYDLCARRIEPGEKAGLDLSALSFALNGSEPVRAETLDRFLAAFGPCGFRRAAFYPAFGLSEGTSDVSGNADFSPPRVCALRSDELDRHRVVEAAPSEEGVRRVVGCGAVLPGQRIAIVDPEALTPCPSDQVGEVWIHGPSVAAGYWARPKETEEVFRARLAGPDKRPFLRTGDLGFLRHGELFITGRLKDLIIIRGANHYPQDIELSVEQSHPALRPGCGAAFSCEVEGEERLAVVHEIEAVPVPLLEEVTGNILQRIVEEHEIDPWQIILIEPGSLPKTSSGKIQRKACREALLAGELQVRMQWRATPPAVDEGNGAEAKGDSVQEYLIAAVARLGGIAPRAIDPAQPFARYGLTSVTLTTLLVDLEKWLGRRLPLTLLFRYPTIGELAGHLSKPRLSDPMGALAQPANERT